jgi:TatD DNase family protein
MLPIFDAHTHLDLYSNEQREQIIADARPMNIQGIITVSKNLESCKINRQTYLKDPELIYPAYGYHPEQKVPDRTEIDALFKWIGMNHKEMVAIGEVGLPYYMRKEAEEKGERFDLAPYLSLLEEFIVLSIMLKKPIILHAVYEDAEIVCDLLEKHRVKRAHFHWFKGSEEITQRMMDQGYFISVTPDLLYEEEIQCLVERYPLDQLMVETDGPWPFEGPFQGELTHPRMICKVIEKIAEIKRSDPDTIARKILTNTKRFYQLV